MPVLPVDVRTESSMDAVMLSETSLYITFTLPEALPEPAAATVTVLLSLIPDARIAAFPDAFMSELPFTDAVTSDLSNVRTTCTPSAAVLPADTWPPTMFFICLSRAVTFMSLRLN